MANLVLSIWSSAYACSCIQVLLCKHAMHFISVIAIYNFLFYYFIIILKAYIFSICLEPYPNAVMQTCNAFHFCYCDPCKRHGRIKRLFWKFTAQNIFLLIKRSKNIFCFRLSHLYVLSFRASSKVRRYSQKQVSHKHDDQFSKFQQLYSLVRYLFC